MELTYKQAELLNRIREYGFLSRENLTRREKQTAQSLLKRKLISEINSNRDDVHLYYINEH